MFKNKMENTKIGQNDVYDFSTNKKAKNVNSNENNAKLENINNFYGTDWIKFLEILNNLETEQYEKFKILNDCKICSKNIIDKISRLTKSQNEIIKFLKENYRVHYVNYKNNDEWIELENLKNLAKQGVAINACDKHIMLEKELDTLYIKIRNYKEIKNSYQKW